jgi:hypothetical protein
MEYKICKRCVMNMMIQKLHLKNNDIILLLKEKCEYDCVMKLIRKIDFYF